jgi:hypothetical protein
MTPSLAASLQLLAVLLGIVLALALLAFSGKVRLRYNLRNLIVRWPTTLLAGAAFTLITGLMIGLFAFVNGLFKITENSGQPGNVMVLSDGATDEAFSNLGFGDITQIVTRVPVEKDGEGKPLASWEVYIVVNQPIKEPKPGGQKRRFVQVRGVDDPAISGRVHNLPLYDSAPHKGSAWFSAAGVQPLPGSKPPSANDLAACATSALQQCPFTVAACSRYLQTSFQGGEQAFQAVLGEGIARLLGQDIGKPTLTAGDLFDLGGRKWIVTGVMRSSGATYDSEVWAKRQIVGPMFGKEASSTLVLRMRDDETARTVAADLSANYKQPAVLAQTELEYFDKLNTTNKQFSYAFGFVTFWLAIGGIVAVMNTMFAAVSQRTKDIGVLRILGYARWQILASFFLESMILALVGGLVGCAAGLFIDGISVSSIVSGGQGSGRSVVFHLIVDAPLYLTGLLFALVVGAIGGLVPAVVAMRSRPLEAVR